MKIFCAVTVNNFGKCADVYVKAPRHGNAARKAWKYFEQLQEDNGGGISVTECLISQAGIIIPSCPTWTYHVVKGKLREVCGATCERR